MRLRAAARVLRRNLVEGCVEPSVGQAGITDVNGGIARNDTVEVARVPLRHQHRFATAGRATGEVGILRGPSVVLRDDLLRGHCDVADGEMSEVDARLLVDVVAAIEHRVALVAGIGGDHGEPARKTGSITDGSDAYRRADQAVVPAAALKQEAAVPFVRQSKAEPDPVRLAVRAGALVQHAVGAAVGGQRRCRRNGLRLLDHELHRGNRESLERGALGRGMAGAARCERHEQ